MNSASDTVASRATPVGWQWIATLVALAVLAMLPNLITQYQTVVMTYGLIMAIAAMGFNLLLGYGGLLSFGHSAYFGVGAYTVAIIVRDVGTVSMEAAIGAAVLTSALVAGVFGIACLRHTRIFFGILTLALSQVLWSFVSKFYQVTGGTDGIRVAHAKVTLLGGLIEFEGRDAFQRFTFCYYYYVLAFFVIAILILLTVIRSPFGKALQAMRDNELRGRFVGLPIERYRWIAFVISGLLTGLAGALYAPLDGHVTPDLLYWPLSGEIVFMVVLGGFRNFIGPIVGAITFTYLKTYAVASTEYWQLVLGSLLIVLVLALPDGIVGTFRRIASRWRAK